MPVEPLDSYEDLNAESSGSSLTIEQNRSRNWIPAALLVAVAVVALVTVLSRDDQDGSSGDQVADVADVAAATTTSQTTEQLAEDNPPEQDPAVDNPATTTSAPPSTNGPTTTSAGQENGVPIQLPNPGIDAWLFVVTDQRVLRIDLATGDRVPIETSVRLPSEFPSQGGTIGKVGLVGEETVVVVGAEQILLVEVDTLTVGTLPVPGLRLIATGDDEVWASSSSSSNNGQPTTAIHRVPISGLDPINVELIMPAPFPFLVAAAVPDGLLVSELLGATWHLADDGSITRRDDISSLLASGDGVYIATSCAANAMECSTDITTADGSTHVAVIDDDFSFGAPMSPDGQWLAGAAGFVDLKTGAVRSTVRGLFGSSFGSWSADSRWFAEPTELGARIHDLSGEFAPLTLPDISMAAELQIVLR